MLCFSTPRHFRIETPFFLKLCSYNKQDDMLVFFEHLHVHRARFCDSSDDGILNLTSTNIPTAERKRWVAAFWVATEPRLIAVQNKSIISVNTKTNHAVRTTVRNGDENIISAYIHKKVWLLVHIKSESRSIESIASVNVTTGEAPRQIAFGHYSFLKVFSTPTECCVGHLNRHQERCAVINLETATTHLKKKVRQDHPDPFWGSNSRHILSDDTCEILHANEEEDDCYFFVRKDNILKIMRFRDVFQI